MALKPTIFREKELQLEDDSEELETEEESSEEFDTTDDQEEEPEEDEESEEEPEEDEESEEEPELDFDDGDVKPSRGSKRIQSLANKAKEAKVEALRARQELEELRGQFLAQNTNGASEQEYLATLTPEERRLYNIEKAIQANQYNMQMAQFNAEDKADRANYEARAVSNPLYKRFAGQVEETLAELRSKHKMTAPRERILENLIGAAVLKNQSKGVVKKKAAARVQKHKVKPTSSNRSDVSDPKRKGDERAKRMQRLESYKF